MDFILLIIAIVYTYEQNKYFGHHWEPQSDAEVIADGISFILAALIFV